MHTQEIPYKTLVERHPRELVYLTPQISTCKSKIHGHSISSIPFPNGFVFTYSYGITGKSIRGDEFIQKLSVGELDREVELYRQWHEITTISEKVSQKLDTVSQIRLCARAKGSEREFSVFLDQQDYRPPELIEEFREAIERETADRKRFQKMKSLLNGMGSSPVSPQDGNRVPATVEGSSTNPSSDPPVKKRSRMRNLDI